MEAVLDSTATAVAALSIEAPATTNASSSHVVVLVEAMTDSAAAERSEEPPAASIESSAPLVNGEVPVAEQQADSAPSYRIPRLKRALSVGRVMELISETERLHKRRKETMQYQGPLLYVPGWIPVPEEPEQPRTRDQKSQTYFSELPPRGPPRGASLDTSGMDEVPLCQIPNEFELMTQLYKRTSLSKIFFGRGVMEEGEELQMEYQRMRCAMDRHDLNVHEEISNFLLDTETRQREIEEEAREAAAWSRYYRLVLEARWKKEAAEFGERVLRRQQRKEEERATIAKRAVEEYRTRNEGDRPNPQKQAQVPINAAPVPQRTPAMTHRSPPISAAQGREALEKIRQQTMSPVRVRHQSPSPVRVPRRTLMNRAARRRERGPETPPAYSISPVRGSHQPTSPAHNTRPQRTRSPAYSISPVRLPLRNSEETPTQPLRQRILPPAKKIPPPTMQSRVHKAPTQPPVTTPRKVQKRPAIPPVAKPSRTQAPVPPAKLKDSAKRRKEVDEVVRRLEEEKQRINQQPGPSSQDEVSLDVLGQYGYLDDADYTLVLDDGEA